MIMPFHYFLGCVLLNEGDMALWKREHEPSPDDADSSDRDPWGVEKSLGDADAVYYGEDDGNWAGFSVAGAGDVNGDGLTEVLIGAPNHGPGEYVPTFGAAYLILGNEQPSSFPLSKVFTRFDGETDGENSGFSVGGAGDVNGDGYDDLIVGATGYSVEVRERGAAYLILGGPEPTLEAADALYWGGDIEDRVGLAVSGAGDVNGDGFDDMLIGSAEYDGSPGETHDAFGGTWVILGSESVKARALSDADALYVGEASGNGAGSSLAGAGDFDGDGVHDIIIGAPNNDDGDPGGGSAYLVLGANVASGSLADADAQFTGEYEGGIASVVAGGRDVDGDGLTDVVIGSPGHSDGGYDAGAAFLVVGRAAPKDMGLEYADAEFTGDAYEAAGCAVSLSDLNGDGFADVVIGATGSGGDSGSVYVVRGRASPANVVLTSADARYVGEGGAGYSVSGLGDVNGDAIDDLVIGAPYHWDKGAAHLILGDGSLGSR